MREPMISSELGGILAVVYQTGNRVYGLVVPGYSTVIRVSGIFSVNTYTGEWDTLSVFNGYENTEYIRSKQLLDSKLTEFNYNGFSDWYIPSLSETVLLLNPGSLSATSYSCQTKGVVSDVNYTLNQISNVWSVYSHNTFYRTDIIPSSNFAVLTSTVMIDSSNSFDTWRIDLSARTDITNNRIIDSAQVYYNYANRPGYVIPVRQVRLQ